MSNIVDLGKITVSLTCAFALSTPTFAAAGGLDGTGCNQIGVNELLINRLPSVSAHDMLANPGNNVIACSTCGCSEITPVAMMEATTIRRKEQGLLSASLWSNLVLDMAYQRDPELKKIGKKLGLVNGITLGTIALISGLTIGQGIASLATLNPPAGHLDSYVPGAIGIGASGMTVLSLGARVVLSNKLRKEAMQRQIAIREEVDSVLRHLKFSQNCAEARRDLETLIGGEAASEFLDLWRSVHVSATIVSNPKDSDAKTSEPSPPAQDSKTD